MCVCLKQHFFMKSRLSRTKLNQTCSFVIFQEYQKFLKDDERHLRILLALKDELF